MIVISRILVKVEFLLPIILILSWCSTFARQMSQSSATKNDLTIPELVICSVTMSTWLLICVVSVLLLVWCIAIIVISTVLLIATIIVSIVLIVIVSFAVV